jgi:molecular chaperone GrpE (heat shock protein)
LDRQRQQSAAFASGQAQMQIESLLAEIARPAAQFITQIHLAEQQGKDLQGRDVLAVAHTLLAALQDYGLAQEGEIGQVLPFDPNRHEPLSAEGLPGPGQPVVIRLVGFSYHGRLLHKAGVTPANLSQAEP